MAAEDFTGPLVLNVQSNAGFSGKFPLATPASDCAPRYIGQSRETSAASASIAAAPIRSASPPATRIQFCVTRGRSIADKPAARKSESSGIARAQGGFKNEMGT